jgi:hypothetical protein
MRDGPQIPPPTLSRPEWLLVLPVLPASDLQAGVKAKVMRMQIAYTQLGNCVNENVKENARVKAVEVFKKVQELGIEKKHKAVQVLAQTLFTSEIITEIPVYLPIFQKVCRYLILPTSIAESHGFRW